MLQGACQVAALEPQPLPTTELLAPPWHTRLLVGLMLSVAAAGSVLGQAAALPVASVSPSFVSQYLPLAVVNVGLLAYVSGVGLPRNILLSLLSRGRYDARRLLVDLAWGAALAFALIAAESALQWLLGLPESVAAHALLPTTATQKFGWLFVAALIGFSEELVYRGYLQRQLTALSGRLPFGVVAQALLFGIAHGEQGGWAVARFAIYGLGLGWLAAARKSLWPCVLGHVVVDMLAGLVG